MKKIILTCIALISSLTGNASPTQWNDALASDSIEWHDENGNALKLSDFSEKPTILTTFYTHCSKTCPEITFRKLNELQKQFDEQKIDAEFILVTIEPEQDTSEILKRFKEKKAPNRKNWHFIRSSTEADTQEFAKKAGLGNFWKMDEHTLHDFKLRYFNPNKKRVRDLDFKNRDVASLFNE